MCVLMSPCFGALFVADLFVDGRIRITFRCRGKSNFPKVKIATISVRMVRLHGTHLEGWTYRHTAYPG